MANRIYTYTTEGGGTISLHAEYVKLAAGELPLVAEWFDLVRRALLREDLDASIAASRDRINALLDEPASAPEPPAPAAAPLWDATMRAAAEEAAAEALEQHDNRRQIWCTTCRALVDASHDLQHRAPAPADQLIIIDADCPF